MLKRFPSAAFLTVYALVLGIALGLGTAWRATGGSYPFGGVRIGAWTAWPRVGSREADPYTRAVIARSSDIPLAVGEGLLLSATVDDGGEPLEATCTYRIGPDTPPARSWTLTVYDGTGRTLATEGARTAFTSAEVLREADGRFTVLASPEAQPGNWLPLPKAGRVSFVLRLYDTPASAGSAALDRRLIPSVTRLECAS